MTPPGLMCANCGRPMPLSRATDDGYVHAAACPRPCAIEGCDTPRENSATWCNHHAYNNKRWGNPLGRPSMDVEDIEWMAETGETLDGAAQRLKRSPDAVEVALRVAGRADVYAHLVRNQRQGVAA